MAKLALRSILFGLVVTLIIAGGLSLGAWGLWLIGTSGGYQEIRLTDFSKPYSTSVRAPLIHTDGNAYIVIEGQLRGGARVVFGEPAKRFTRIVSLSGPEIYFVDGGAEYWSDGLTFNLLPDAGASGQLTIRLYCGAYPKLIDFKKANRGAAIVEAIQLRRLGRPEKSKTLRL